MLLLAEKKFRRLGAPEMLRDAWHSTRFEAGFAV